MAADKGTAVAAKSGKPAKTEKKKEKKVRIAYPGLLCGPDGKPTVKLKEWPTDFDHKTHQPLARSDFENEAPWLRARAERLRKMADRCLKEAELAEKFGNKETRQKVRRMQAMQEQAAAMARDLQAQGIDPTLFIKNLNLES